MPKPLRLLREEITYSKAKTEEVDILRRLQYYDQQHDFFATLSKNRSWIEAVVAHHLGLSTPNLCQVADVDDWLHGSFNVCIPVSIDKWEARAQSGTRVLLRLPLPHRCGEDFRPGNCDEKVRCEAGTYAWLQENCPDIPIPRLYGFATSDGETVDDDWHITSLVDLEWACSRPVEMLRTPTWLTTKLIDEIAEEDAEYNTIRSEFIEIMQNEEKALGLESRKDQYQGANNLSEILNRSWRVGTFWFSLALASPTGLFAVFYKQIQPRFSKRRPDDDDDEDDAFHETMPCYWAQDFVSVGVAKQKDRREYDEKLKVAFGVLDEAD